MIKKLLASLLTMCIILSPFVAGTALAADGDIEISLTIGTCTISGNGAYNIGYDHPVAGEYYRGSPAKINPVDDQTLADLTEGYGPDDLQTATLTITNITALSLQNLDIALGGASADSFVVTQPPVTTLPSDPGSNTTSFFWRKDLPVV